MTDREKPRVQHLVRLIDTLQKAVTLLQVSIEKCAPLVGEETHSQQSLESFEALTARFARLSDILIQKVFRIISILEQEEPGSSLDLILRAEKIGLIESSLDLRNIRGLRNEIAHEYAVRIIDELASEVLTASPILIDACDRADKYAQGLIAKLGS